MTIMQYYCALAHEVTKQFLTPSLCGAFGSISDTCPFEY
jgi:hypothetical protein